MPRLSEDARQLRARLRRQMRQERRQLHPAEQRANSLAICDQLLATLWFRRARRIGCYLAADGEPDLRPLLPRLARRSEVWLPVIAPLSAHGLEFRRWCAASTLPHNRFGIGEPLPETPVALWSLDLLLVPLVAFDHHGQRLGRGGGFYDRVLADLLRRPRRPLLVGIAHDFQECAQLPAAPWDRPLDCIVTNRQIVLSGFPPPPAADARRRCG